MLGIKLLAVAYVVYLLVVSFLAYNSFTKEWRPIFLKISIVTPPMFLFFAVKTIFSQRKSKGIKFNENLAVTEDRIESRRVQIFGGKRLEPSIAAWWQSIARASLENTVRATKKFVGFDKPAHPAMHR